MPKDAALPIGSAADGPSLWHSILDTYGKEILKCASREFLDLATAARLEAINRKDLTNLLAKAGRLGYKDSNSGEHNAVGSLVQEANGDTLGANFASTLPGARTGRARDSTASSRPSLVEASRGPKRRRTDDREPLGIDSLPRARAHPARIAPTPLEKHGSNNVKLGRGDVGLREQMLISAMASGSSGLRTPAPRASHALKRVRFEHGVCPGASSGVKQTPGTLAQRIDLVVISAKDDSCRQ